MRSLTLVSANRESLESLLIFNMALERWFRTIVPRFPKINHSLNLSERDVPEPIRPDRVSGAVVDKAWHVFSSLVSQIFFRIYLRSLPHSLPSYLVDSYLNDGIIIVTRVRGEGDVSMCA